MFGCQGGSPLLLEMLSMDGGFGRRKTLIWKKFMFQLVNGKHLRYFSKMNVAVSLGFFAMPIANIIRSIVRGGLSLWAPTECTIWRGLVI